MTITVNSFRFGKYEMYLLRRLLFNIYWNILTDNIFKYTIPQQRSPYVDGKGSLYLIINALFPQRFMKITLLFQCKIRVVHARRLLIDNDKVRRLKPPEVERNLNHR